MYIHICALFLIDLRRSLLFFFFFFLSELKVDSNLLSSVCCSCCCMRAFASVWALYCYMGGACGDWVEFGYGSGGVVRLKR